MPIPKHHAISFYLVITCCTCLASLAFQATSERVAGQQATLSFRGIAYSPWRGVGPDQGEVLTTNDEILVRADMQILSRLGCTSIRLYGISLGLHEIPAIAAEYGIETQYGAWISSNAVENQNEISLIASHVPAGETVIVGTEVLMRNDLNATQLNATFTTVKAAGYKVAYADGWWEWEQHPEIANAVDVICVHVYPFWENISLDAAANFTVEKFQHVRQLYPGKPAILSEAGWPSGGALNCSEATQQRYFSELLPLLAQANISADLFSAFDEAWKAGSADQAVGARWGLFRENRCPKPAASTVATWFGGTIKDPCPSLAGFQPLLVGAFSCLAILGALVRSRRKTAIA